MAERKKTTSGKGIPAFLLRLLMVLVVLGGGAFVSMRLMKSGPTATRKAPERRARLVEVQRLRVGKHQLVIEGMGRVQPTREIDLYPRVNGEVRWISPLLMPGGHFLAAENMLQIDGSDYALVVSEGLADLAQAQSDLKLERGQQSVALREFKLLGETIQKKDRELVLRLPQLEHVRAGVAKAQSALKRARLDLKRTRITAPFNAIVRTQEVDLGSVVTNTTQLATLIGTDSYRVEVLIPVNQLPWIRIPGMSKVENGSSAKIYDRMAWGEGPFRTGNVIRLAGDLETEGRMARLLVEVADPLGLQAESLDLPHLLIGSFVRVSISGRTLTQVIAIDRAFLRDSDTVWLMNEKDALEIREIDIVYRSRTQVFVSGGLKKGERLVTSDLAAPLSGMPLRTQTTVKTPEPQ